MSLQELPASLRQQPLPPSAMVADIQAAVNTEVGSPPSPSQLGALDLPALPGQQPREGAAKTSPPRGPKRLARADLKKARGLDASAAPEDLRCAIDGKLLGTPVRSPYGHVFERDTLELWLKRCGSVCPITGQELRLEECPEDRATARRVAAWVREAQAEHRSRTKERRAARLAALQQAAETTAVEKME